MHAATPLDLGMLGCGVVGTQVAELLLTRHELYTQRCGRMPRLVAIAVRDPSRPRAVDPALLRDAWDLVEDPAIRVVIEVMGGVEPARTLLLRALETGKHVVTANKELIAKHGSELFAAARARGVGIYYEGSVAGGIPLLMPLKRGLAANHLTALEGIINGTTNFILTRMRVALSSFEDALTEAQRAGYAEADPAADVDGHDAAYKLALLASVILGARVPVEAVHREGIRALKPRDLAYARELGYEVKLLGIAKRVGDRLEARVHPTMIPRDHPLARIDGVTNAITVFGDPVGAVTFAGPGAGGGATASAVVGDVLDLLEHLEAPSPLMQDAIAIATQVVPLGEITTAYYLRLMTEDVPGVLGELGTLFGQEGVSIRSFVQKEVIEGAAELVFVTHAVQEAAMQRALARARDLRAVREIAHLIRVEETPHAG